MGLIHNSVYSVYSVYSVPVVGVGWTLVYQASEEELPYRGEHVAYG
jgi:hypothetical protein